MLYLIMCWVQFDILDCAKYMVLYWGFSKSSILDIFNIPVFDINEFYCTVPR